MKPTGITVYELYGIVYGQNKELLNSIKEVYLEGWIKTNRNNGSIGFIEFNDGTNFKSAQLVYTREKNADFDSLSHLATGSSISVFGQLVLTPDAKQAFEIHVIELKQIGDADQSYPLQKKHHSFEFLRDIAHLRPRANSFNAVFRVRSVLSMAIHKFFQDEGFVYVHTPIITTNDGEGAGEVFKVVTDAKNPNDFYGVPASLTVTGQLHVEAFAMAFRDVYTFGPVFRAEKSNTVRHASEFWMVEPEIAFADLEDDMELIEACIKYCIRYVQDECPDEMSFFNEMIDKSLMDRLNHVLNSEFVRMSYTDAISTLQEAINKGHRFDNPNIRWGMDLQSEHERYITEEIVKGPVFITDYPKEIKAFYMKQNEDGKTVAACDLLVPYVGELVGGSQREDDYEKLLAKMKEIGNDKGLEWYLDLRKYGGCPHAGFGIGFDRLLMYLTGMSNIRDVQPFPRTSNALKY